VLLVSDQPDEEMQRAQVARMVAGFRIRNLRDGMVVAVGMGRNVGADIALVSLGPDDLRRIPLVIGIASEPSKVLAILAALRSGVLNAVATRKSLELDEAQRE
jgi:DNA-binding transcriptional regulator LsrR (DeoR family)